MIIIHTHKGPIIVSRRKNRFTSSAGINLGAIVTKTNGTATHIKHIKGTIIRSFSAEKDLIIVPLMCLMCVAVPFVLVTIAPRFIPAEEVNLFFLLETIIGPLWVWMIIKEQPSIETIQGGLVIIITIAIHSFLKLKKS